MDLEHLTWPTRGWGYLPPILDVYRAFEYVREHSSNVESMLEIGFHAGHSSTYILETFTRSHLTTYGISTVARTAVDYMKEKYGDRITIHLEDAKTLNMTNNTFDFAFVDGSHKYEAALHDVEWCMGSDVPFILVDNCERHNVSLGCKHAVEKHTRYQLIESFEYWACWNNKYTLNRMDLWSNV